MDGVAGARDGLTPSISIANGAPSGADAPNTIAVAYAEGPVNVETAKVWLGQRRGPLDRLDRTDRGLRANRPADVPGNRDLSGRHRSVLTYDSFLQPWQPSVLRRRGLCKACPARGHSCPPVHRSGASAAGPGEARGSSANALTDEFLGDYNFAFATDEYGVAVWNAHATH